MEKRRFGKTVSRRDFLKASAALGAAAALSGCSGGGGSDSSGVYPAGSGNGTTPYVEDTVYTGMCRSNCWENCRLNIHVRNGRVVRTSMAQLPDTRYNRICLKGLSHVQRIYHPDRILYPLRRVKGTERGAGQWEKISWETAFTEIAEKFANIRSSYDGTRSIATLTGSGNYGSLHGIFGFGQKLGLMMGASGISSSVDNAAPMGLSKVMGKKTYNFMHNNEPAGMTKSKTIITWGSNITESQMQTWHFIADAMENNGATHINIDVRYNTTASKAHHFVHVKPGSDTILALHMMKFIMDKYSNGETGYIDDAFVIKNTSGPFLVYTSGADAGKFVRDSSSGTDQFVAVYNSSFETTTSSTTLVNGTDAKRELQYSSGYVLEHSGEYTYNGESAKTAYQLLKEHVDSQCSLYPLTDYTGVSQDVMEQITTIYATNKPSNIYTGFGTDHYANGHHHGQAVAVLGALTGNIGKEGAGVGHYVPMTPFMNYYTWYSGTALGASGPSIPWMVFPTQFNSTNWPNAKYESYGVGGPNEQFPVWNSTTSSYDLVQTRIRGIYIFSCNPVSNWVDQNAWVNADESKPGIFVEKESGTSSDGDINYKFKTIVVSEMSMTDTARYADYVLPAAHWFEAEDFCGFSTHPYMLFQDKAAEPLGEAKPDLEIVIGLGRAMGLTDAFPEVRNAGGTINETVYNEYFDSVLGNNSYATWYKGYTCKDYTGPEVSIPNLREQKVLRYLPGSASDMHIVPASRDGDNLFFQGTGSGTGRVEIYCDTMVAGLAKDYGQMYGANGVFANAHLAPECMPTWEEADEVKADPANPHNGYVYMQEHTRWRVHTQWYNVQWLRELDPNPTIQLSVSDAGNLNISTGDMVRIYNDRGEARAKAVVTAALRPGVVNMPKGWQKFQTEGDTSFQALTNRAHHEVSVNQSFFDAVVQIEKLG